MKKLLLFCLLSVFMSMTYVSNAQSPGSGCCFWLENAQPDTQFDTYNLNPMATSANEVQYYYFKFDNTCGLDPLDKISIDWQITVNGQPIDAITLGQLEIEIETRNPYLNLYNNGSFVPSGQLRSGQGFGSALGCPSKTDYPGGLGGPDPLTYCQNTQAFTYFPLGANNLYNFFYVQFLQYASDNNLIRLKINRKSWAVDFKINVQLIRRTGGEAYENPYKPSVGTTHYYMGGKLAQRVGVIGSFTLEEQTYLQDTESACSGQPILVGLDPNGNPYSYLMTPTIPDPVAQMVVNVPFYNQTWDCVDYIDQMVLYTLTWAPVPAAPIVADQTRCGAGTITFTGVHSLDTQYPGQYPIIFKWYSSNVISPANLVHTGNTFTTPALVEDQEVTYWVTASIVAGCEGLPQEVTAKAYKQPIVTLTNPDDLCPDAGFKNVIAVVTNAYDTEIPYGPEDIPAIPAQTGFDLTVNWTGATQTGISNGTIYAQIPVTNACNATYTYSVTITDDVSGCTATASSSFTLIDTQAPTFVAPAEFTAYKGAGCALNITPAVAGVPQNIQDNCDDQNFVITHSDAVTAGNCTDNYMITRTWIVADHCGNATSLTQKIYVRDIIAPTITSLADATVYTTSNCSYNANPTVLPIALDNCTQSPVITFKDDTVATCAGSFEITRTWRATDNCGNYVEDVQMIFVRDNTPPTFVVPPTANVYTNATCQYNILPAVTGEPTLLNDNCSTGLQVTNSDAIVAGTCTGTFVVTRTWRVTDNCGNFATATQTINVLDNTAPTFAVSPTVTYYKDANCQADTTVTPSALGYPTSLSDNCTASAALVVTHTSSNFATICAGSYSYTRTWRVTDNCGNFATATQTVNVLDNTRPTFTVSSQVTYYKDANCQADTSVTPSALGYPTALLDNCTAPAALVVTHTSSNFIVECAGAFTYTRTWTVTDACGNFATATQTVNVLDNTRPTFTVSSQVTYYKDANCQADTSVTPSALGYPTALSDNCTAPAALVVTHTSSNFATICAGSYSYTRTWTVTDACGNFATATQTVRVEDNIRPTFAVLSTVTYYKDANCQADTTVSPTALGYPTALSDNCTASGALVVTHTSSNFATICAGSYSYTRTWRVTDNCGNFATATQTVRVEDNIRPTFAVLSTVTYYKDANCQADTSVTPSALGYPTALLDNCTAPAALVVTHTSSNFIVECAGAFTYTRTWTVTDACGNFATATQTVRVEDNIRPTFTVLSDVIYYKDGDCMADTSVTPAALGYPTALSDNCTASAALVVTHTSNNFAAGCAGTYTYTRTWRVTDNCGNFATATQTVNVVDTMKPTFTAPLNTAVCKNDDNEYNAGTGVTGLPTNLSDNCTAPGSLVVTFNDVTTLGGLTEAGSIVRTWTVRDACLNTTTATQTIILNAAPVASIAVTPTPSFCLPETGSIAVTATLTGTPAVAYTYHITKPNTTVENAATAIQYVSTPGIYTFTGYVVNTSTGCASAVVSASTEALLYPDFAITNVIGKRGCRNDVPSLNGSFNVTNNALYTYTISPNVGSYSPYTFSNLPIGNYNVTATHSNGCSYTKPQAIVFDPSYTPIAKLELGGRDADTAICWTSGLYLSTLVTDLNNVFAHTYNYHIIVPVNVTALGSNGVRIEQPGIYAIGGVVENVTTGCRDTAWHYVYAMAYPGADVTANPFCLNTNVDLTLTATPVLVAPHNYTYRWTSVNTGATVLGTTTTLSHLTTVTNKYYGDATANYSYSGLNAYGQTLTFSLACTTRDSLTVTPLPLPVFIAQQSAAKRVCNAADPGAITIGSGWNAAYTWTLTRVSTGTTSTITTQTFNVPDSGYYHITAVDLNGCTYTLSNIFVAQEYVGFNAILHADILPLVAPADKSANLTLCWDNMDERLYHEIRYTNNPVFSYQYTIITPNNIDQVNSNYSLIRAAGTYLMSGYVTNLTTGCVSNIDTLMVYAVPTPVYTITPAKTICRGESIKVGITPISTFTTVWAAGPTTNDSLTITPAMYGTGSTYTANVTVTATLPGAGFGCTSNNSVVITINDQPVLGHTQSNVLCNGGATGAIDLSVTGASPFTYNWSNGATTQDISGLIAGTYGVTVTDVYGCISTRSITITQPALLAVEIINPENVSCFGRNDGGAIASATGGFGAYTYTWSNLFVGAENVGLIAGTYTVTVKDANNCTATASIQITQPLILSTSGIVTDNVCNGGNIGAIDLTVNGGTTPYSYIWSNTAISQDISGLTANTYQVTVTDFNGCTVTASYTVNQPAILSATVSSTNVLCNGANNGTITITLPTGGSGSYEYRLNTGTWQSSGSFTALPNATYSVQIRDANATSCVITLGTEIITQPTLLTASITAQTDVACFGLSTGSATVTPAGGTLSYSYSWGTTPVQTDATATGLAAGTYVVTVTDGYLCTTTTSATIIQPLDITLNTPTYQPIACNGGSTTVNMTATGGTGQLEYTFNGVSNITGIFNTIIAGTYNYSVTDANECGPKTGSITIGQPTAVSANITSYENLACYAVSTGTATVTAGGGTPGYTYLWSNTQTSAQATGLAAATYTVTVRDANGCTASTSVTLIQPDAIVLTSATVTSTIPCNGGTGTVTIIATGGTGTISYTFNGSTNTTGIFTGVLAGTRPYSITDVNGCGPITGNVEISEPALLTVSFTGVTNNTCNGAAIGTATASPSGGTPSYNYAWSTGATTTGISSLAAGTYTVTITDNRGCTTSNSVLITEPAILNASVASTNVSCNGGINGTITVSSPTGGFGTYQFRLNTGTWQGSGSFTGLAAGTYSVQIRDAAYPACFIVLGDQVITQPTAVTATISAQQDPSCNGGSNGTATVTAGGGTPGYTYLWSNTQTNAGATGLSAALLYSVTVTDANGCSASTSVTLGQPTIVTGSASVTTAIACNGGTGTVTLLGSGGTGAISFTFNGVTNGTGIFTGISAGVNYPYSITDANNCGPVSGTLTVSQPTQVTASITAQTNVACHGNSTGSATVTPAGGTVGSGYTYSWGTSPVQTGQTATGLAAGTYGVTVTDGNGCTTSTSVTITQPAAPLAASITSSTNILCFGTSTGAIDLTVTGGTTIYGYAWTGGAITQDISGLAAGTYTVTVTDAALCTTTASVTLTQPASAVSATTTPTHVKCFGGNDGSAQANPAGGVGPYTYSWNTAPVQTGQTATGLIAGTYIVTVTDANNCTTTASAVITQPTVLSGSISTTSPICTGTTTLVDLTVTGGTGTITYLWSSSETTQDITKGAGTYTVTITDGNLCTATASTTITNHATPTITSNEVPQVCLSTGFTVTATSTQTGTWSAQAYKSSTAAAVGAPQTGLSAATFGYTYPGSAVSDTIYIVYTFTSSIGGCTYTHTTNHIKMSGEPRLRIYRTAANDNAVTINQNTPTNFHFMVDNTCNTDPGTRLAITYTILKDGVPVANLTDYVTNANSFRYQMPLAGSGLEAYYPDFNYTTTLTQAPAAHFPLATSSGAVLGSDQFDFFSLAFFSGRQGTVSINNFTQPGVYTIQYALITNYSNPAMTIQHGNQIGVMTSLTPSPLGGNQFFTGTYYTKVWSTNTMTITVNPVPGTPIEIIETPDVAVRPAEQTPELKVYPNPSTPSQSVFVEISNMKGDAILTVTNINGKVIERVPMFINEGQTGIIHTIYNTVPGMYFITLTNKEAVLTKKLIIQPK